MSALLFDCVTFTFGLFKTPITCAGNKNEAAFSVNNKAAATRHRLWVLNAIVRLNHHGKNPSFYPQMTIF